MIMGKDVFCVFLVVLAKDKTLSKYQSERQELFRLISSPAVLAVLNKRLSFQKNTKCYDDT